MIACKTNTFLLLLFSMSINFLSKYLTCLVVVMRVMRLLLLLVVVMVVVA